MQLLPVISRMLNNSAVYREPLPTCMQLLSMLQKHVTSKDDAQVTTYTAQAGWMDIVHVPSPASLISQTASHALSQLQKNAASEATHTPTPPKNKTQRSERQYVRSCPLMPMTTQSSQQFQCLANDFMSYAELRTFCPFCSPYGLGGNIGGRGMAGLEVFSNLNLSMILQFKFSCQTAYSSQVIQACQLSSIWRMTVVNDP